jgi:uncharacterized protein (UPF0261 family)
MTAPEDARSVRSAGHDRQGDRPTILVIGTLDTKSVELGAVAGEITSLGGRVLLLDTSGRPHAGTTSPAGQDVALISREEVAEAGGLTGAQVDALPRGEAVVALRRGVEAKTLELHANGRIDATVCVGGAGAYVSRDAFHSLPIGFPKLVVSPLASGNRTFEAYVGTRDVATLHSVADLVGVNPITSSIFRTAAGYIVGAARAAMRSPGPTSRPSIAISMNGNTTDGLMTLKESLEDRGYTVVAFHANGVGGRALEEFAAEGDVSAILDFTTTELAGHEIGGLMDAGADRMENAGKRGLPQVLVPGCLDFITCGDPTTTDRQFPGRPTFLHNPELTLVRLTAPEMSHMGRVFAEKANRSQGPVTVCVPTRGLSVQDAEGRVFWDPEADQAFVDALTQHVDKAVTVHLVPSHINDPAFGRLVLEQLLALLQPTDQQAPHDSQGIAKPSYASPGAST